MPSLIVFGRKWSATSDTLPLVSSVYSAFHVAWIIVVSAGLATVSRPSGYCAGHASLKTSHQAFVWGILGIFIAALLLEVCILIVCSRGGPLELSKRRAAAPLVYVWLLVLLIQIGWLVFGTVLVEVNDTQCWRGEQTSIRWLLYTSWAITAVEILVLVIQHGVLPESKRTKHVAWQRRVRVISYMCNCYDAVANVDSDKLAPPVEEISNSFSNLVRGIDLERTDVVVGLVLVAYWQRNRRRELIRQALQGGPPRKGGQQSGTAAALQDNGEPEDGAAGGQSGTWVAGETEMTTFRGTGGRPSATQKGGRGDDGSAGQRGDAQQGNVGDDDRDDSRGDDRDGFRGDDRDDSRGDDHDDSRDDDRDGFRGDDRDDSRGDEGSTDDQRDIAPRPDQGFREGSLVRRISCSRETIITPSARADVSVRPNLSPTEAAHLYTGLQDQVPLEVLQEAQHWFKFARAPYGTSAYMENTKRPWISSYLQVQSWRFRKIHVQNTLLQREITRGTDRELDFKGAVELAGISEDDVVYMNYKNTSLGALPYMIVLDRERQAVVLSIRGTRSLPDLVTDLYGRPVKVEEEWYPQGFLQDHDLGDTYCHVGIMEAAKFLLSDLDHNCLLSMLLEGVLQRYSQKNGSSDEGGGPADFRIGLQSDEARTDRRAQEEVDVKEFAAAMCKLGLDCRGWQLVVTGHSLGAGVAAIMAIQLKHKFPGCVAWSFCPPGGLMSSNLSAACASFCTSVCVGKDPISRSSMFNISRLMDEMIVLLARCRHHKLNILCRSFSKKLRDKIQEDLFCDYHQMPQEALDIIEGYFKSRLEDSGLPDTPMYPPANMFFLRRIPSTGTQVSWEAVWISPHQIMSEGLLMSSNMTRDHYTSTLRDALDDVIRQAHDNKDQHSAV